VDPLPGALEPGSFSGKLAYNDFKSSPDRQQPRPGLERCRSLGHPTIPRSSPVPLRNALVTGASAGLGRELVRQLVRDRGMTVLATARRLDRLDALAAELPPGRVVVVAGDLADADFRARLWAQAETLPGGLDLLVNNA